MGFSGAPVSTALLAGATAGPMVVSFLGMPFRFLLRMDPQIVRWHQYYRLATSSLIWTDQVSVLLGAITLYNLRVVERFFGPRRFGKLVVGAWALSTGLTAAAAWGLYAVFDVNLVFEPGAIGLLSALVAWYVQLVPATYYVKAGAATFSDKFLLYVMFALLFRDWGDVVKALAGLSAKAIISFFI